MKKTKFLRKPVPDPRYGDELVSRFVNNMMIDGKKDLSYSIFYGAMDRLKEKNSEGEDGPLDLFKKAIDNVTPSVEVRSRRVGGATFQIPQEVRPNRRVSLAMKWLIRYSRERNEKEMKERLANEILAAANEEGGAFKKKEDTHRMAESNKAFSHFRF